MNVLMLTRRFAQSRQLMTAAFQLRRFAMVHVHLLCKLFHLIQCYHRHLSQAVVSNGSLHTFILTTYRVFLLFSMATQ